jgi:hypothetical protein
VRFLCKFPSRSRPGRFMEVFGLYRSMLSGKHDMKFILSFDEDDISMNNPRIHKWLAAQGEDVSAYYGKSKSKIQAINADMDKAPDYDILILASDDMVPVQKGYDDIIATDMQTHFPDLDGVLHYNDGVRGDQLNTLCIMGKPYYDRFGYIYHPDYTSVFCDNEFTEVSRMLGKAVYIDNLIVQHKWMDQGKDALYERNENPVFYGKDYQIYAARKENGFPCLSPQMK